MSGHKTSPKDTPKTRQLRIRQAKRPRSKKRSQDELDRTLHDLNERIKELNCIYDLSKVLGAKGTTIETACKKILEILPGSMQYPDITAVRVTMPKGNCASENFRDVPWQIKDDIYVRGQKYGHIEIAYLEERPASDIGPFLAEEQKLLEAVTEILGTFIEQVELEAELDQQKSQLKTLVAQHTLDFDKGSEHKKKPEWRILLDFLVKTDPQLLFRVTRKMLYALSKNQNESIDTLMMRLKCPSGDADPTQWCGINAPNPRMDVETLKQVQSRVFDIAAATLPPKEIEGLLTLWLKQDKAMPLILASHKRGITLREISEEFKRFKEQAREGLTLSPEDDKAVRTNLIRRFLTERHEFINVAKQFVTIEDLQSLMERIVGPGHGSGKLGGKAAGIYLAEKILQQEIGKDPELKAISFARSWYLSSDTMWEIIHYNALDDVLHLKYLDPEQIRQEQPFLEQVFKNAVFPAEVVDGLRRVLRDMKDRPIIVRSSSLLEDSYGAAFSGKYKSLFLANQGSEEERLKALVDAISEVYASTFGPDPIEYRRERGLLDYIEEMGILIQEVVGTRIGPYYCPAYAGVAFSNNEFRWSPRITRGDGVIRLVAGLGTRAVDRVSDDYPILVSPYRPEIRVNMLIDETIQYSQRYMDVVNLETGIMETIPVSKMLGEHAEQLPGLSQIVSIHREGHLMVPSGIILDPSKEDLVVTFGGLIEKTKFINQIRKVLMILKEQLGSPVDVEFASDGKRLFILQCRPQSQGLMSQKVSVPEDIPNDRKVFSASKYVTTGLLCGLEYIVYVDPEAYDGLGSREAMISVAHAVGSLNLKLPRRKFILMGPGRWGSRGDIKLGVPVQYRDINNTSLLIEIAKKKGGYLPELSFGTHFFQDLVEAHIQYLPLYPDDGGNMLSEKILHLSPNRLTEVLTNNKNFENVIKVIRVDDLIPGGTLTVAMDGEMNRALAYLMPPDHGDWRIQKVGELARDLDPDRFGVVALYVIGSAKENSAGPGSDLDLLVHVRQSAEQTEDLKAWFSRWSRRLAEENLERTGVSMPGILDVHYITDQDIKDKSSWAVHIGALYNSAREIPLPKRKGSE